MYDRTAAPDGYSSDEWLGARHQQRNALARSGKQHHRANVPGGAAGDAQKENQARHTGRPRAPSKLAMMPRQDEQPPDDDAAVDEEDDEGHPSPAPYDAADDIQDIDRRLNALQQFLVAAKGPR